MQKETIIIRQEHPKDYAAVEMLTREAFWNVYCPGCSEHYLAHIMRTHKDFIPELTFVAECGGAIAASIMYMRSWLEDDAGNRMETLSFGPISVHPDYQRRGLGKRIMAHSFEAAAALGYPAVVIFGNPENYVSSGFKSCKRYHVTIEGGAFPTALFVRELREGALDGRHYVYRESDVCELLLPEKVEAFDRQFPPKEKAWMPSQEKFYIYSHSTVG